MCVRASVRIIASQVPRFRHLADSKDLADPAPVTAGAAPPNKKAPRSECAIDTDR